MTDPLHCGECGKTIELNERAFAQTQRGPRFCAPCWQIVDAENIALDAKIDRWHAGYFSETRPTDPDELEGWLHRRNEAPPVPVVRPEGYYHQPLGTFE